MEDIILVGYGGHAKSVADCIERNHRYRIVGYTDLKMQESLYQYLGTDDVLQECFNRGIHNAAVCIGYLGKSNFREKIYVQLKSIGFQLPVIADPAAVISESAQIGEGTFIGKSAIINAEANVGKMTIINTRALIEHECSVGDFTHIAVGAILCGMVNVGSHCLIGAHATILQRLQIGNQSIIGAGTVVTRDVIEGVVMKNRKASIQTPNFRGGGWSPK